jgi:hypothetical protein
MQQRTTQIPDSLINYAPFIYLSWIQVGIIFCLVRGDISYSFAAFSFFVVGIVSSIQVLKWKKLVNELILDELKPHLNAYVCWVFGSWICSILILLNLISFTFLMNAISFALEVLITTIYRDKLLTGKMFPSSNLTKHRFASIGVILLILLWALISKLLHM